MLLLTLLPLLLVLCEEQISAAWQVLSDGERKARYDGSGGRDDGVDYSREREDVDPIGVFAEAFQGYTTQEV